VHEERAKTIAAAAANTAVEYYGHSYGMCVVSKFKPLNSIERQRKKRIIRGSEVCILVQ